MNSVLITTITRRAFGNIFKRKFYTNRVSLQSGSNKKGNVQASNPFCLEELQSTHHTMRKHNQEQRQRLYDFGIYVAACLPRYVQKVQMQHTDELEILIQPEGLHQVLSFLAHHQNACFNQCSAVTAIDVPSREYRFEVIYILLSMRYAAWIRVKTYTDEVTPLRSASSLWWSARISEREVYDLFGIVFTHHPDLRRLLTDYGFTGHPLRKDFPVTGYIEVRYDDELKKIVYEPVEFIQEMRQYKLESPWNHFRNFHEGYNAPVQPEKPKK